MPLASWFNTFCNDLKIGNRATISARCGSITTRLTTDFWPTTPNTSHSLYVGSYGRNTAIDGISDVDVIFELPWSIYHQYDGYLSNGQSALLQAVRQSIITTYSSTSIGASGQVVVASFSDGMKFEILPAFSNNDGSYTFPDSNSGGSWKRTDPRSEIKAIRGRNTECNGNLVQLCHMSRAWRDKMNVPIPGLLIDTLAYQFIGSWKHRNESYFYYDFMCRDFFAFLAKQDEGQTYWKAPGSGQWVYSGGKFQYKARRACNIAKGAIAHETASPKREWLAKQKWREVFGTSFPS